MRTKLHIEMLAGPSVGESHEFTDDSIRMGRGSQCELRISSPHVSRMQCELSWQGDQVVLQNLGTVNHTYLNDRPIDRVYVQDGDLITFCDVALRIRMANPGAASPDPDKTVVYNNSSGAPGVGAPPLVPGPAPPEPPGASMGGATRVVAGPGAPNQHPGETTHPPGQAPGNPAAPGMPGAPGAPPGWPAQPGTPPQPGGFGLATSAFPAQSVPTAAQFGPNTGMPGAPGMPPHGVGAPNPYAGPPNSGFPQQPGQAPMGQPGGPGPGRAPGAGRARKPPNIQLVRNIVLGMAALVGLILVSFVALSRVMTDPPNQPTETGTTEDRDRLPEVSVDGRTPEEIVRDAEVAYNKAVTFMRESQVADGNLWLAISKFKEAKAELLLVEPSLWPPFAREINPGIQKAEGLSDEEFTKAKLKHAHYRQSGDYEMAMEEMNRVTRMIPDREDDRNQYARRQKKALRALMAGTKKESGPF
ncbi:MAG: hypothetical protein CL928_15495 [Deltaproteobacteria bacterium]|nr:hypothetical protein [Deltaproteobacteria bacterium]